MAYESQLTRQQPLASTEGQLFESLSQRMSAFANRSQNELDRDMAKKAKEKGLADAQGKTEITLRDGTTIADEAWNAGAITSNMAAIKLDITENSERIFTENKDPAALKTVFDGYASGVIEGVPEQIQPAVKDELATIGLKMGIKAQRNKRSEQLAERAVISGDGVDLATSQALDAIDSGDIEQATQYQEQAESMIDAMIADTTMTPAEGAKAKQKLKDDVDSQIVIGGFKRALESNKDEEYLTKFSNKKLGNFFSPKDREKLLSEMLTIRNRRNSISKIKRTETTKEISNYIKALANGFTPSNDETLRISKLAEDSDMTDELNKAVDDIEQVSFYGKAPASQRRAKIAEVAQGGQLEDYAKWTELKKADQRITKAAQKDGYALALQQKIIDPSPLDYTNPESFKARTEQAKMLSQHYGVEVSPFTDAEVKQLIEKTKEMTPQEQAATAMAIGAMESPKIFKEITKNKAPIFAMMAAVGDPDVAETVFRGQIEIDAGNIKLPAGSDKEDMLSDMYTYLGDVYTGEDLAATREAVFAHYAASVGNAEYDDDKLIESMKAVTGGIAKINGSAIELPRGTTKDDMEDFMDEFSAKSVVDIGGVDFRSPEDAADMIRNGIWRSKGDGTYAVITPFGELMQNGKPLRIKYDPELTPRRTLSFSEFQEL